MVKISIMKMPGNYKIFKLHDIVIPYQLSRHTTRVFLEYLHSVHKHPLD